METEVLPIQKDGIERAARLIAEGRLVAFPTETVYGLGADGMNAAACAEIFAVKGRPADNPLILHLADAGDIGRVMAKAPDLLMTRLMEQFWPGPLTMVVPSRDSVPALVRGGLETVAVRVPGLISARKLIAACNTPLAAPSANRSGKPSPTTARHVLEDLGGRIPLILDGGPTAMGVESTVLDMTVYPPQLLRPGALAREAIEAVAGTLAAPDASDRPRSPGMKYRHYAPNAPVFWLQSEDPEQILQFLATLGTAKTVGVLAPRAILERIAWPGAVSLGKDDGDAARRLYAGLRALDAGQPSAIVVVFTARSGLGEAVANRLAKASHAGDRA